MNVRITPTLRGERPVLKVAGRLQSADLSELDKEVRLVDGPFVLDLSELLSADEPSIERLRELGSNGGTRAGDLGAVATGAGGRQRRPGRRV